MYNTVCLNVSNCPPFYVNVIEICTNYYRITYIIVVLNLLLQDFMSFTVLSGKLYFALRYGTHPL
jgi:hypothetical protein